MQSPPLYPSIPAKQYIKIHVPIIGPPIKSKARILNKPVEALIIKSLINIVEIHPKAWMKKNKKIIIVPTMTLITNPIDPNTNMNSKTQGNNNSPTITKVIKSGMKFHTS